MGQVLGNCLPMGVTRFEVHGRTVRVIRRLGSGGFSFVDLVADVNTRQEYAMKRIPCRK